MTTYGRSAADDKELDWDAVLPAAELVDDPADRPGPAPDRLTRAPGPDRPASAPEPVRAAPEPVRPGPAPEPVWAGPAPERGRVAPGPERADLPVAPPVDRPAESAPVSLGAGWSVLPGPGRWGGTLRISEQARDAVARKADGLGRTAGPDWTAPDRTAGPDRASVAGHDHDHDHDHDHNYDYDHDPGAGPGPAGRPDLAAGPDPAGDPGPDVDASAAVRERRDAAWAAAGAPRDATGAAAGEPRAAGRGGTRDRRDVARAAGGERRHAAPGGERRDPAVPRPSSEDLTPDLLVRERHVGPGSGWRGAVYRLSGGTVDLGPSAAEQRHRDLLDQVRTPMPGCFRVAVVSLKGGVGKTTATFCLGATLASLRGDRVLAIDANPDVGTLAEHVVRRTRSNLWDLLSGSADVASYADVRTYTSQSPDRLEVLASARDPQLSHAFDAADYEQVMTLAERFYSMVVTDCGTGMMHSAMTGVLSSVDQLVLVSSASLDGARSASATLDWLEAQGHGELAAQACVVVNSVRSRSGEVDLDRLADHFEARTRAVVTVPYDPHLARGTTIELAALQPATREAWLRLAASVVTG